MGVGFSTSLSCRSSGEPYLVSGDIQVQGNNITLTEGSQIEASTIGNSLSDLAPGIIEINATDTIIIDGSNSDGITSGAFNTVYSEAVGNSGNVTIETASLRVRDGADISVSTSGEGNAGDLKITASELIEATGDGSGIFARVNSEATGEGGNVTIDTASLQVSDGADISATTLGEGNAGDLTITASDSLEVTGDGSLIVANVNPEAIGEGGNVTINTSSLRVSDDAEISVSTFGEGNAGDLTITASDSIELSGQSEDGRNGLFASALIGSGDGGNIIVHTNKLTVKDGATINVSNRQSLDLVEPGTGQAGNIIINAGSIILDNDAIITAETASGEGGNITLQLTEDLILKNNSSITAQASEEANGGNININAGFIVGFPSTGLGSDIRANAVAGRGGDINIITNGILGFEESRGTAGLQNNTNDIDASSEFNLDGDITISSPDTNPLQRTDRLPTNPVSAETIATEACSPRGGGTSLTYKGKGGAPPEPTAPLSADALIPDGKPIKLDKETDLNSLLVEESEQKQEDPNYRQEDPHYIPADIKPIKTDRGDIYPARGVIKTEDGRIILTTYPTENIYTRTPHKSANCNILKDEEQAPRNEEELVNVIPN